MSASSAPEIGFVATEPTKEIFVARKEFSSLDKARIREELEASLIYLVDCGFPCTLEGLGIIFPIEKLIQRVTSHQDHVVFVQETVRTVDLEKTDVIYQCHRTQFINLLEDRDISDRVFEKVHSKLSFSCKEPDVRKEIKALFRKMKSDILVNGWSNDLEKIGLFVAHHNRQGDTQADWFAGADIFLDQPWQKTLRVEKSSQVSFPKLHSPFEPFEMQFGPHQASISINLTDAITALGYESSLPSDIPPCEVRLYNSQLGKNKKSLTFVTNGLRQIGFHRGSASATEVVIQLNIDEKDPQITEIPQQIQNLIAAAALLSSSAKNGNLVSGVAAPLEDFFGEGSKPNVLMCFPYRRLGQELRCFNETGAFYLSLLTLITSDEAAALTANHKYLLSLFLKRKGYQQELRFNRSSVFNKTAVDEKFTLSRQLAV